jgi:DNA-binding MarR family transcriptional regulator
MPTVLPLAPDTVSRLRLTFTRLGRQLRQHTSGGVTASQLSVLATLDSRGPLPLSELAAAEQVQRPSMTRIVASLEDAGLVMKVASEDDRRMARAELTAEGRRTLDRIRRRRDAWLAERLGRLSPDEAAHLEAVVPLLERLLEDAE